jgi:hypothetical protein
MNRRKFLQLGAVSASGIALAESAFAAFPNESRIILYGDFYHDDTKALQAWLDGKQVHSPEGVLLDPLLLTDKLFFINKTLIVPAGRIGSIQTSGFRTEMGIIFFRENGPNEFVIQNCGFHGSSTFESSRTPMIRH